VSAVLFSLALRYADRIAPATWFAWAAGVALTMTAAAGIAFAAGLSADSRRAVARRVAEIARRRTPKRPST